MTTATTRRNAAFDYLRKGWHSIPVPVREKKPNLKGWQNYRATKETINQDFAGVGNIGLLLGEPSGNLVDIDLDWAEASALARFFLPATKMLSGRKSAPLSHWWYVCEIKTQKFVDPNKQDDKDGAQKERAMIVEIRSTRGQTIVEPSIHPSGESYEWTGEFEPTKIEADKLRDSVAQLAASSLMCRYWREGLRHHATLALSGWLMRNGWELETVSHFIRGLATVANDEELEDRLQAIQDTADKFNSGGNVTGLPTLSELFGEKTVNAVAKWLGLRSQPQEKSVESVVAAPLVIEHCPYKANGIGLVWQKPVQAKEGGQAFVPVQLTNFVAEIVSDVSRDDGAEQTRVFEIRARLAGESAWRSGSINATDFSSLPKWIHEVLGAKAVVFPSKGEHAKVAIQLLSSEIQTRRVVAHTGWRNDDGRWLYYHNGGAIGAVGLIEAEVDLPISLAPVSLPQPPTGERLREVVRAIAFDLANVAPEFITLPIIASAFAAMLTNPDFSIFLVGYTGSGKSELAALLQSFFGSGFHAKNLPAAWTSSANSLEAMAHTAKDCVLTIDDFCPIGSPADQSRLHAAADRVLRAQGNHSGRGRCRADGSIRPPKPPRGLILSTGEDMPRGQSLRARNGIIQIEKDSVNWNRMTECQQMAQTGVFAEATSAFLQWLATENRIERLSAKAAESIGKLRNEWLAKGGDSHKRSATMLAQLQRAWQIWLEFAADSKALESDEIDGLREAVEIALERFGQSQGGHQLSENPALRFIELIQAALSSGKGHLAALDGGQPEREQSENREVWGWRDGEAQGDRIGWLDGDDVYLQPDAAYRCAQSFGLNGEGLTVTQRTLWKRLREAGFLVSCESEERQTIKKQIGETRPRVLHLRKQKLSGLSIV